MIDISRLEPDLSAQGLLLDIDRFASHDGPGIRTAVFLKGCPLRCIWCHSPESQLNMPEILYQRERCTACWLCLEVCPVNALSKVRLHDLEVVVLDRAICTVCGKCVEVCYAGALKLAGGTVAVGDLVADIARNLPYFESSGGGVTLSGGEPARQPEFSYNFLLACKKRGIHTALETTGYAWPEVMSALASVADLLLYDVKHMDSASHQRYVGVPNKLILDNLEMLATSGHNIQVRVPCIPGFNDSLEQIDAIAQFACRLGIENMALLPYNAAAGAKYEWLCAPFTLSDRETQSAEYMESLAALCSGEGLNVQIGG